MKRFEKQIIASIFVLTSTGIAYADTAFNYNQLEFRIRGIAFAQPVEIGNAIYKETAGFGVSGSYQFAKNFFVSLEGEADRNAGLGTDISSKKSAFGLGFVSPVSPSTDAGVKFSFLSGSDRVCGASCINTIDNSALVDIFLNSWLAENFELNVSHANAYWQDSSGHSGYSVGIGRYVGAGRDQRLGLSIGRDTKEDRYILISYTLKFKNVFSKSAGKAVHFPYHSGGEPKKLETVPVDERLARPPVLINIKNAVESE